MLKISTTVLLCTISLSSVADKLHLTSGEALTGEILEQNFKQQTITFLTEDGIKQIYSFSQVAQLERQPASQYPLEPADDTEIELPSKYSFSIGTSSVKYFLAENLKNHVDLEGMNISFRNIFNNYFAIGYGIYFGNTNKGHFNGHEEDLNNQTIYQSIFTKGLRVDLVGGYNLQQPGFKVFAGLGSYAEYTTEVTQNQGNIQDNLFGYQFKIGGGYQWQNIGIEYWSSFRTDQAKGFADGSTQQSFAFTFRFN